MQKLIEILILVNAQICVCRRAILVCCYVKVMMHDDGLVEIHTASWLS